MKDVEIIGMIKSYVKKTLVGMGALKGAPCEVQGVVDAGDGTQTLTLQWKDTAGVTHTTDITLPSAIFAVLNPTNGQTLRYNSVSGKFENSNVSFSADLEDLDNVVITSVQDGQVLTWDAANNRWINADGSTVGDLSDLDDVVITTAQNGQLLSYNGTTHKWVNISLNIDDLGNVSIASAADGQVLTYDAANNRWINANLPEITVDSALDTTSENPVQNKVIALTLNQLSASKIGYDGTASGLAANKVQGAIDELASEKVDKETGKGLSTNDFTDALKNKLDGIEDNAEVNDIDTVKVNGTALTPDANKAVNIELAVNKLSDVDLTGLADEMILIYDATNNKWYAGANTGATYTAGEGIEIDQNNKISSKIVLFTGTEAQWNALPLADKIKFTHYATNDDQTGQIDPVPTQNSNNLMTSGGIYTALQAKADTSDLGTAAAKDSTNAVTAGSSDLVESGAVDTALADKADKVSNATSGNFAGLDANGNLTDSGKTDSDFATPDFAKALAGIGSNQTRLTGVVDLDDLTTEGWYFSDGVDSLSNKPFTTCYNNIIHVQQQGTTGRIVQTLYSCNYNTYYSRVRAGSIWSDWKGFDGNYSTTEQFTGKTWIDSKPIYRKVLSITLGTTAGNQDFAHGISNLEQVTHLEGQTEFDSNNASRQLDFAYHSDNQWDCCMYVNSTTLRIQAGTSYISFHGGRRAYITIEYTKTTD